jgi:hypothetical protein
MRQQPSNTRVPWFKEETYGQHEIDLTNALQHLIFWEKNHASWRKWLQEKHTKVEGKKNLSSKPNQTHKKPSWAICSLAQILKNEAQTKWSNSPNKEELRTTKKMTPEPSKREGKKWPQESLLWWHPQWFSNALVFFLINIDLWTKLVNIYIYTRNFGP